ncbi:MAG TPA: hypothetical protein VN767_03330 [Streptosporangiaceae bacterium]|nr:hypothetical protein [Streptosporangiaceae bacterium]
MAIDSYWLTRWIDEMEIFRDWEVGNVFKDRTATKRLIEAVEEAAVEQKTSPIPSRAEIGDSIVAGSQIDLSGTIGCSAYECMQNNIDDIFKNIWHYFDRVVVQGLDPRDLIAGVQKSKSESAKRDFVSRIHTQMHVVLHLREIGADDLVTFQSKPHHFCEAHWREQGNLLDIEDVFDPEKQKKIISRMIKDSSFESHKIGPQKWAATLSGPGIGPSQSFIFSGKDKPSRKCVAGHILRGYTTATVADVELSRRLMLPLVAPTSVPWAQRSPNRALLPTAESVALELSLPVFIELPVADFLKLRRDQQPYFDRFRDTLHKAIVSRLTPENAGKSAGEIAHLIEVEDLRPGLADIECRVRSQRKAVIKQSAVGLAIGAISTTIGALDSMPLIIAGGAIGSSVPLAPLINRYISERDTAIPKSELYFLWQASKHAKHRRRPR